MKIQKIQLENFKRFSNLQIDNIPDTSKLILLIGENGSGKSSLFDAFEVANQAAKGQGIQQQEYYKKDQEKNFDLAIQFDNGSTLTGSHNQWKAPGNQNLFYGRTSFRQVPRLTRNTLGRATVNLDSDSDRPKFYIDRDNRFQNDIEKITESILQDVFRLKISSEEIQQKYIDPINVALKNIFGKGEDTKIQLVEIIPPLEGKIAQLIFKKGNFKIHYNYLSAGEKEVFNLLINLLSRNPIYQDSIYFLDEMDLHLDSKIQFNLLKEITENWIPKNCQIWTATHSLGFIEYAKQSEEASIINFSDLDFDLPQFLSPEPKDNPDIYEIAVGKEFLPSLFKNMNIYFVENKDKNYYATIGIPNSVFIPETNRNNVYHKARSTNQNGIVDRDYLSDDDITEINKQYSSIKILKYYSIENYMYHPDNLEEYYASVEKKFDKAQYIANIIEAKNLIKDSIILHIAITRQGYPYFGEPEFNGKELQKRFRNEQANLTQSSQIQEYLNSNDFEVFYKSLPMKTFCTQLLERQNISKPDLVKTNWFKDQLKDLIK